MRTSIEVAEYIEQLLKAKNMSAAELARRTDMNKSSISRYFNGDRKIPMDEIPKFAKALGVQPEELLIKNTTSEIVSPATKDTAVELKSIMAKNIQQQLDKRGISQTDMARDLKIPEMTVSNWMKAKTYPRIDKIQLMADYFNILCSDLTEEQHSTEWELEYTEYDYFPDIHISAGDPFSVEAIESAETIIIPDKIMGKHAGNQDIFFAHVNGDSMNKIIPHGSLIAVKPVSIENLKDGDIVVFSCCHEYSVKRFYTDGNRLMFKPESTDYRFGDYIVNNEHEEIRIHGKVITYIVNRD